MLSIHPLRYAEFHRRVADVAIDMGIVLVAIGWTNFTFAMSESAALGLVVAGFPLIFGVGLYLPSHFIGQELFDVGGLSAVVFVYVLGIGVTGSVVALIYVLPMLAQQFVYFVLLVTAVGGRTVFSQLRQATVI